jgi:hypothetical protein
VVLSILIGLGHVGKGFILPEIFGDACTGEAVLDKVALLSC